MDKSYNNETENNADYKESIRGYVSQKISTQNT